MQRLEVSHDGGSVLHVVFFCEGWHLILDPALDHERHMRTTYLELQKARRVLASVRVLTVAVSAALKEKSSSFGCQVCRIERLVSWFRLSFDGIPIDSASRKCRGQDSTDVMMPAAAPLISRGSLSRHPPAAQEEFSPEIPCRSNKPGSQ